MREERKERRGSEKKREENKSESGEGEKRMECARERRESRGPLAFLSLFLSSFSLLEVRGDLPSRAKPLINAFAKKLHAVGGKQEQEGVGRARSNTRDLCSSFSPSPDPPPAPLSSTTAFHHLIPLPRLRGLHVVKRANLRSQFDRDSGPDSQATDRSHPRATKRTLHFSAYFRPIPSPDTLLPSFRGRRYMEVYSFFFFLPLLECKRG